MPDICGLLFFRFHSDSSVAALLSSSSGQCATKHTQLWGVPVAAILEPSKAPSLHGSQGKLLWPLEAILILPISLFLVRNPFSSLLQIRHTQLLSKVQHCFTTLVAQHSLISKPKRHTESLPVLGPCKQLEHVGDSSEQMLGGLHTNKRLQYSQYSGSYKNLSFLC